MIGFILTGHGTFADGLMGSLEMIAGPQEDFTAVPFRDGESLDGFESKMLTAVKDLKKSCSEVIIFTDLIGGSPFRTAMVISQEEPNVEVIAGTNLPILIESIGLRYAEDHSEPLIEQALAAGRSGLEHTKLQVREEQIEEEGGI